jgi:hypothetical protein
MRIQSTFRTSLLSAALYSASCNSSELILVRGLVSLLLVLARGLANPRRLIGSIRDACSRVDPRFLLGLYLCSHGLTSPGHPRRLATVRTARLIATTEAWMATPRGPTVRFRS